MHPSGLRAQAAALHASGLGDREVGEVLGVPRSTVRDWRRGAPVGPARPGCPRCDGAVLDDEAYAELLGWYLGDGCLSLGRRGVWALRVTNDVRWPGLNDELATLLPASEATGGSAGCGHRGAWSPR